MGGGGVMRSVFSFPDERVGKMFQFLLLKKGKKKIIFVFLIICYLLHFRIDFHTDMFKNCLAQEF